MGKTSSHEDYFSFNCNKAHLAGVYSWLLHLQYQYSYPPYGVCLNRLKCFLFNRERRKVRAWQQWCGAFCSPRWLVFESWLREELKAETYRKIWGRIRSALEMRKPNMVQNWREWVWLLYKMQQCSWRTENLARFQHGNLYNCRFPDGHHQCWYFSVQFSGKRNWTSRNRTWVSACAVTVVERLVCWFIMWKTYLGATTKK